MRSNAEAPTRPRRRRWIWILPLLVLVLLSALVLTERGLQLTLSAIGGMTGGQVRHGAASGNLLGTITVEDLQYEGAGLHVAVARAQLRWEPAALLLGEAHIRSLHLSGVRAELREAATATPGAVPRALPPALLVQQLSVHDLTVSLPRQPFPLHVQRASVALRVEGDTLHAADLHLVAPDLMIQADGSLVLAPPWRLDADVRWSAQAPVPGEVHGAGPVQGELSGTVRMQQALSGALTGVFTGAADLSQQPPAWSLSGDLTRMPGIGLAGVEIPMIAVQARGAGGEAAVTLQAETIVTAAGTLTGHGLVVGSAAELDIPRLAVMRPGDGAILEAGGHWQARDGLYLAGHWLHLRHGAFVSPSGAFQVAGTGAHISATVEIADLGPVEARLALARDAPGRTVVHGTLQDRSGRKLLAGTGGLDEESGRYDVELRIADRALGRWLAVTAESPGTVRLRGVLPAVRMPPPGTAAAPKVTRGGTK